MPISSIGPAYNFVRDLYDVTSSQNFEIGLPASTAATTLLTAPPSGFVYKVGPITLFNNGSAVTYPVQLTYAGGAFWFFTPVAVQYGVTLSSAYPGGLIMTATGGVLGANSVNGAPGSASQYIVMGTYQQISAN